MADLCVRLFGKLTVQRNYRALEGLHAGKVQELFCYLLLHRDRPHPRETLASLLWGECSTQQSKKYLRQALWRLHLALHCAARPLQSHALVVESDSIRLNSEAGLWLDVAVFEKAFASTQGIPGELLDARRLQALQSAVPLYRGDLLEGWYQDWCLYERERLQNSYLAMLDKLMGYCEAHRDYEAALAYGQDILRRDRARELTYQRLMRLQYLAGDRAGALRQYQRCIAALQEHLDVRPAKRTVQIYEQIRADHFEEPPTDPFGSKPAIAPVSSRQPKLLGRLRHLQVVLLEVQHQVRQEIQAVERASATRTNRPFPDKH